VPFGLRRAKGLG